MTASLLGQLDHITLADLWLGRQHLKSNLGGEMAGGRGGAQPLLPSERALLLLLLLWALAGHLPPDHDRVMINSLAGVVRHGVSGAIAPCNYTRSGLWHSAPSGLTSHCWLQE